MLKEFFHKWDRSIILVISSIVTTAIWCAVAYASFSLLEYKVNGSIKTLEENTAKITTLEKDEAVHGELHRGLKNMIEKMDKKLDKLLIK